MFYYKPDMTSSWFLRQGALHAIFHDGFWKSDHDFILVVNGNFCPNSNGFEVIRQFLFAWDFPTGREILGFFGENDPQKVKISKNTCLKGTSWVHPRLLSYCALKLIHGYRLYACQETKIIIIIRARDPYISPPRGGATAQTIFSKLGRWRDHPIQISNQ